MENESNMCGVRNSVGWGGGKDRVGGRQYTPLYKKGIKKTQNKSMETTNV